MNDYRAYPTGAATQYSGNIQSAQTNALPCAPPTQPRFDQIADGLANLPNTAYGALQRLRTLADRYGGTVPEAVSKGEATAGVSSLAGKLEASVSGLESLLAQIHSQLDRLERF